jgi:hypothetical protein
MGVTIKVFIVEDDDRLRSIPLKQYQGLMDADPSVNPLPEYADRKIRYISVTVGLENRKPAAIGRIYSNYLCFDENGRINQDFWEAEKRAAVESLSSKIFSKKNRTDNVIEADHIFKEKRHKNEFHWTPTLEIEKAVTDAVFAEKKSVKKSPLRLV